MRALKLFGEALGVAILMAAFVVSASTDITGRWRAAVAQALQSDACAPD